MLYDHELIKTYGKAYKFRFTKRTLKDLGAGILIPVPLSFITIPLFLSFFDRLVKKDFVFIIRKN